MATVIDIPNCKRILTADIFADLGVPSVTFEPISDYIGIQSITRGYRITFTQTLTPAQIQRARCRVQTWTTAEELLLVSALNAIDVDTAFLAIPAPTAAEAITQVITLTQQMKAVIEWIGKDILA